MMKIVHSYMNTDQQLSELLEKVTSLEDIAALLTKGFTLEECLHAAYTKNLHVWVWKFLIHHLESSPSPLQLTYSEAPEFLYDFQIRARLATLGIISWLQTIPTLASREQLELILSQGISIQECLEFAFTQNFFDNTPWETLISYLELLPTPIPSLEYEQEYIPRDLDLKIRLFNLDLLSAKALITYLHSIEELENYLDKRQINIHEYINALLIEGTEHQELWDLVDHYLTLHNMSIDLSSIEQQPHDLHLPDHPEILEQMIEAGFKAEHVLNHIIELHEEDLIVWGLSYFKQHMDSLTAEEKSKVSLLLPLTLINSSESLNQSELTAFIRTHYDVRDDQALIDWALYQGASLLEISILLSALDFCYYSGVLPISESNPSLYELNATTYSPLHLAVFNGDTIAIQLLREHGYSFFDLNDRNISPLDLYLFGAIIGQSNDEIGWLIEKEITAFSPEEFKALEASYSLYHGGANPFDFIEFSKSFTNTEHTPVETLLAAYLRHTDNPLYTFIKHTENDTLPSLDPTMVHIGISDSAERWSTGVWSMARQFMPLHPDIQFHIVSKNVIDIFGAALFEQMDAMINPGGADSYPYIQYFTKKDCPFETSIEQVYQTTAQWTAQLDIPYLGMCAGAQHLALYHGSTLGRLSSSGDVPIHFIPGTLSYFKALTPQQKADALHYCLLPDLKVMGYTAHSYGAYPHLLGEELELGATLNHKIAMAYTHHNGLFSATQFHPEYCIGRNKPECANQIAWLEHFFDLARMHHAAKQGLGIDPKAYYSAVSARLAECMESPTSLVEPFVAEHYAIEESTTCQGNAW